MLVGRSRNACALLVGIACLLLGSVAGAAPPAASAAPDAVTGAWAGSPRVEVAVPLAGSASAEPAAPASVPPVAVAPAASARRPVASGAGEDVRLGDVAVFVVRGGHEGQTALERARGATEALKEAASSAGPDDVRVEMKPGVAVVYAGKTPIVQLYPDDAARAGDSSLEVHAAAVASSIREAMRREQKRSAIAKTVLSLSFVVVLALLMLFALRKFGELAGRAQKWLSDNPGRIPAIRLKSLEVVGPRALRSGAQVAIGLGKWVAQIGVVYVCLVLALSLFDATRGYTSKLTGFVLGPLSGFAGRIASALPLLVVAGIAGIALLVLVRFVGLFFASVARGETHLAWLPPDLAPATSVIVRSALVVAALVFAAPVVTGDTDGALTRAGAIVLVALGLASTPLLASAVVGATVLYLRRIREGQYVEIGTRAGRVKHIGLLDVCLEDADGCDVRVPHLLSLVHPTRVLGARPRVMVTVATAGTTSAAAARDVLFAAAAAAGESARVEIVAMDADGARFRVSAIGTTPEALYLGTAAALADAGIAVGRVTP